jgi:hypothetical protein
VSVLVASFLLSHKLTIRVHPGSAIAHSAMAHRAFTRSADQTIANNYN